MKMPNKLTNVTGYDLFFKGDERLVDVMLKVVQDDVEYPVVKSFVDNPVNGKVWALTVKWDDNRDYDMDIIHEVMIRMRSTRIQQAKQINRRTVLSKKLKYMGMEFYCQTPLSTVH